MIQEICPICEEGVLEENQFTDSHTYRGVTRELTFLSGECTVCGSHVGRSGHSRENLNKVLRFYAEVKYGQKGMEMPIELLRAIYDRHLKPKGTPAYLWSVKLARTRGLQRLPRGLYAKQHRI